MLDKIPHIRFADPWWLALLAAVPLALWLARRSIAGLGTVRGTSALATRVLVITLLAAALARAQLVLIRDDMAVAFVVDRSLSVPNAVQERLLQYVARTSSEEKRPKADQVSFVTFGKNAAIDQPFGARPLDTATAKAVIETGHTNIAAAIRTAVAAMPDVGRKRIVLISDGNENDGAALSEAASARASGVRVDCLPVRYSYSREVMVEKVVAPSEVPAGKTVSIRAVVRAFNAAKGKLRLLANGEQIAVEDVTLRPGANVFVLDKILDNPGVYDFKASIETEDDSLHQNNNSTAFSIVRGEKKVLLIEGRADDAKDLAQALAGEKVAVEVRQASAFPNALELLTAYDTVILVNTAAFDLAPETIKMLAAAVKNYGLGLVMVGGEDAFGAGGWKGTEVEDVLPVEMDVKDRQIIPTGALVIVMHTCEFSDGNRWGIEIAKAALKTLGNYDEFGILYYGAGEQWLFPLAPVTDRAKLNRIIDTMMAGDMPSFDATLRMAEAALTKSQASVKHIVIISDGDPQPPTPAFLQQISSKGITVSTVAVFPHDGFSSGNLQAIAKACKGRYYFPANANELPQIFIKEARTVRRGLIFEKPFRPSLVAATEPVKGFKQGDFPALQGYVITTPKPLAEQPLVTNNDDPLLAHWQFGLGRTAAFTSDAKGKWASAWLGWDGYNRFWGQLVEWVERKLQNSDFTTSCTIQGDVAKITVDAIDKDGQYVNFLQFAGSVLAPDGSSQEINLEQTGPGHYEGTFAASDVGTFLPMVNYKGPDGVLKTYTTAVTVPFSPEYRALSTNELLLKEISDVTGGRVINEEDDVFRRDFAAAASYTDIWQWMLAAAIVLFLADVFTRRVILDYAAAAARVRGALWWVPVIGVGRQARKDHVAYTSALLSAKRSVRRQERQAAAKKFVPDEAIAVEAIEDISREQAIARARVVAEKSKSAEAPAREIAREAGGSFTQRLLEAKKRAQADREQDKK